MTNILRTIENDMNSAKEHKADLQALIKYWQGQSDGADRVHKLEKQLQFMEGSLSTLERLAYLHAHELRELAA